MQKRLNLAFRLAYLHAMQSVLKMMVGAFLVVAAGGNLAAEGAGADGWVVLFDGTDLVHWEVVAGGTWCLEDGVLAGRNGEDWTTNPEQTGSWLRSRRSYSDFELELEYAISPGGNSGIFLRAAKEKNPAFTGYEMQITDCHGKNLNQYNSGLYDVVGADRDAFKPAGEFNRVHVRAVGPHITIQLNGETIVDFEGDRREKGHIGLQNHDERSVVRFRNIRIRPL